jgi:hypothetical protein
VGASTRVGWRSSPSRRSRSRGSPFGVSTGATCPSERRGGGVQRHHGGKARREPAILVEGILQAMVGASVYGQGFTELCPLPRQRCALGRLALHARLTRAAAKGPGTMNFARVLMILGKDLRLGPRSPIILWALVLPAVMTLLV